MQLVAAMIVTRYPIFINTIYIEINWMGKNGREEN
jgi:hypothetical protein